MRHRWGPTALLGAALFVAAGCPLRAQEASTPQRELRATPFGMLLDFHPDGAWRAKTRRVAVRRDALRRAGRFAELNAAAGGRSGAAAVTGRLQVPAILFRFADRGLATAYAPDEFREVLFAPSPPPGRPYTARSYYAELSSGLVELTGVTAGWYTLPGAEAEYTGEPGTCIGNPFGSGNCNGIFSGGAYASLLAGLRSLLIRADSTVNFGLFDNDGEDGFPNSGDDDGVVDIVIFLHSEIEGACGGAGNNHIWPHKSSALDGLESTDLSMAPGVRVIRFRDYTIQSALGGPGGCDSTRIMPIGTTAHELGHAFGLPDLYDVEGVSEGIGYWGLMGSGNRATEFSPARLSAWSLDRLGWITTVPVTTTGPVRLAPIAISDTALLLDVQGTNARDEYFLLENRQPIDADTALIRVACEASGLPVAPPCGGGLAIWHVDGERLALGGNVNSFPAPHGVALEQADGQEDLRASNGNPGDGGDLYPGVAGNMEFGLVTTPTALNNEFFPPLFVGFVIDSIRALGNEGAMGFDVRFGSPTVVRAADARARVRVDGVDYGVFRDLPPEGSVLSVSVDSVQSTPDERTRFVFKYWSDFLPRTHDIVTRLEGDTVSAVVWPQHLVRVQAAEGGRVVAEGLDEPTAGGFVREAEVVRLIAVPDSLHAANGWRGDTTAAGDTLVLTVLRPYELRVEFVDRLFAQGGRLPDAAVGRPYEHTVEATGGSAPLVWTVAVGPLPPGLALATSGRLAGTPRRAGTYPATLQVRSALQITTVEVTVAVTAPELPLPRVLGALVGTDSLEADALRYLDFLGNENEVLDVGDFLAWVRATAVTAPADALGRVFGSASSAPQ